MSPKAGVSTREAARPLSMEPANMEEDLDRGPPGVGGTEPPRLIEYLAIELGAFSKPNNKTSISSLVCC